MNNSLFENRVVGIEPFTLLDYPGKIAAILFYSGCNFRCPYCYNVDVVKGSMSRMDGLGIKDFLKKRIGKLDAIVFSGGECTIHGERLKEDIRYTKSLGYLVKLDTNGTNPKLLQELLDAKLIDYVAMDFKALQDKMGMFSGNVSSDMANWMLCYAMLNDGDYNIPFEVRTTTHTDIINEEDISKMCSFLKTINYKGTYYVQNFFKEAPRYMNSEINRSPRNFDVNKVDTHGIKVEYRNFDNE